MGFCKSIAAIFALIICLAAPVSAAIRIDYAVGFENTYRPQSWTPIQVRITGAPSNAAAILQLTVTTRDGTKTYSKPIRLQAGAASDTHSITYFQPNPGEMPTLSLQVFSEGRRLAERKVEQTLFVGDSQPVLAALTQDRGGFGYLHKVDLGFQHTSPDSRQGMFPFSSRMPGGTTPSNPTRVLYPGPAELPDNPYAYKWIDAVILADLSLDTLTESQWNALVQWVRDGGALVVSGGSDPNRFRAKQVSELLPVSPAGVKQLTSLSALSDRYLSPIKVTKVPVITGPLRPDAAPISTQGDVSLLSYRRLGNGVVVFAAFDLMNTEIRAWPGQPAMWEEIMQVTQGDLKAAEVFKSATTSSYGGMFRNLADALAGIQSTEAPSFAFIGLFLLAYIVLLVPVNYMLLRKWDKKELAWVTAPVIILLFTTGAYAVGYSVKGGTLFLRYASVVEGYAGSENWNAYTVASVFSPRQTRYDISVADSSALANEVTLGAAGFQGGVSGDLQVERGRKTTIKDALISMWDNKSFAFESHVDLGGAVTGSVVPSGEAYKVSVTNNTRHRLEDAMLSFSGASISVGPLGQGQSWNGAISRAGHGVVSRIGPVVDNYSRGSTASQRIKSALSNAVTANESALPGNPPLILSAWFTDPVQGLTLENERPRSEGQNLLVVHLPSSGPGGQLPFRRAARLPANPPPFNPGGGGFSLPPPTFGGANANALNNQAYTLANSGRLKEALSTAYRAHALAPNDGNILDTVAEMHQRLKQYPQAASYYRRALSRQGAGGIPETHLKYGETLLALKRRSDAITHFQQAAARDYGTWGARARQHLTRLGVTAPTPGSARGTPSPTATLVIPQGARIPPTPTAPGTGRRRILQRQPNGGMKIIVQEWDNTPPGMSQSQSEQIIPPGQPIPP